MSSTTIHDGRRQVAFDFSGDLSSGKVPLVCLHSLIGNSSEFDAFTARFQLAAGPDWPVLVPDLIGRGRSSRETPGVSYSTRTDANDVAALMRQLGIHRAIFIGQGHGGQVAMLLAALLPTMVAGAALIDAGPKIEARGLIRLARNMQHLSQAIGADGFRRAARRVLASLYPALSPEERELAAARQFETTAGGRAAPRFDMALVNRLAELENDDLLPVQWPLFDALAGRPLLLMRTELTDLLSRQVFEDCITRRPDAVAYEIGGEGTPALLGPGEASQALIRFVQFADEIVRGQGAMTKTPD